MKASYHCLVWEILAIYHCNEDGGNMYIISRENCESLIVPENELILID